MSKKDLEKFTGTEKDKVVSRIRKSLEQDVALANGDQFYKEYNQPTESKAWKFLEEAKEGKAHLDDKTPSRIMEFDGRGKWRWRKISNAGQFQTAIKESEEFYPKYLALREQSELQAINNFQKNRKNFFEGFDSSSMANTVPGPFASRPEFSPLIGSPFFKQMYLQDYFLMHSKCFWYKNYSGIAKAIVEMTRNFVVGDGFSVTIDDQKAKELWEKYEDSSDIHSKFPIWVDEGTFAGESMIKKIPMPGGMINHKSIDPSTIWEIVTEPTDIEDIKYYHQQYNTQYQIFATNDIPSSRYVINQIPPSAIIHKKFNCTSWEKRGRSDLLSSLLYLKHFDDAVLAKLIRYKVEMSTVWDVTIKGSEEDILAYLASSESVSDVPPNSENVHNESLTRVPLSPTLGRSSDDAVINWIMAYIALSVNLPTSWLATTARGGETKASAVVKTEPVVKKMLHRRKSYEEILNEIFDDVMAAGGLNPDEIDREFNFPEMVTENRSQRIIDVITARDNEMLSQETAAHIVAQQLDITNYDFDKEQEKIAEEKKAGKFPTNPDVGDGLTQDGEGDQAKPRFDRAAARQDNGLNA